MRLDERLTEHLTEVPTEASLAWRSLRPPQKVARYTFCALFADVGSAQQALALVALSLLFKPARPLLCVIYPWGYWGVCLVCVCMGWGYYVPSPVR